MVISAPVVLPGGGWVRAELFQHPALAMTALTSPIYAGPRAPARVRRPPTTGPPPTYENPFSFVRP